MSAAKRKKRALPAISKKLLQRVPPWPPVDKKTAKHLAQLYCSRLWSFNGAWEQRFSRKFAAHHTARYGVMMVNGTVTMECALRALGVGPGDEVIVPALTWVATAMAACYVGATPVFVDIEPDTLCLDPERVQQAITRKTKAIIPVHLYGSMADMQALKRIAKKKGIFLIEDCAHGHGGIWAGKGVGSIGHIGSFSFQQSKTLPSGEGGMCLTNSRDLYRKLFRLKHIGYGPGDQQGKADAGPPAGLICRNYRSTDFQALILAESLAKLKSQTRQRDRNVGYLRKIVDDIPGIQFQARGRLADLQGYYAATLLLQGKRPRVKSDAFIKALNAQGLACGGTYGPVYKHMLWNVPRRDYRIARQGCKVCEDICANRAICISQPWLLADRPLLKAMGLAIRNAAAALLKKK